MTKLADAVDAINHYTGTEAETERILDLALPAMTYNANRFHRNNPALNDVSDLVAYQQLFFLKWLKGGRPQFINQSFLVKMLYVNMINEIRIHHRDFRQRKKYFEFVNQCVIERRNEWFDDMTMSDIRITIDELDVKDIVKDILFKLLIDQYEVSDLTEYYNLTLARISQLFDVGMKKLCARFELVPQRHYATPKHHGQFRRRPEGFYIRQINNKDAEIIADYQAGMKMAVMEHKYQKSKNTIISIVKRHGCELRKTRSRNQAVDELVINDYLSGMSLRAIGKKYGYHHANITNILMRNGIEPNRRGKKAA